MTREPHIPMSPKELPQQRIHEVVGLPARPTEFNCDVGYGASPKGSLPSNVPHNMKYLAQVEWAWSPMNNRIDAYYLHKGRTHWSLWSRYWDDNWSQWSDMAIGCVPRRGVSEYQAAVFLLLEFWRGETAENTLDKFHWINETEYLGVGDLAAIVREVW
jgi:hypothetical protein